MIYLGVIVMSVIVAILLTMFVSFLAVVYAKMMVEGENGE